PQLARALRPEGDGAAVGRGAALDDRGKEARLRGSGQVLCRSEIAKVPVAELISKSYAERRRKLIDPARANARPTHGEPKPADTIYMTVADKAGNAVSLIQSNYSSFGSSHVAGGLGFALQNRGTSFALDPSHPNWLQPHKRPFHTIIPGFVTKDGKAWLSFGLMGGDMQARGTPRFRST